MAPVATRRRFDDDDDLYDDEGNGPYDRNYPGRRVIADKGSVRVPIYMTDAMPPEYRAALSRSSSRASLADAERAAEAAYYERNRRMADAWRSPSNPPPPDDDPDEDPRAAYERRMSNAWRNPPGNAFARPPASSGDGDEADTIQRATARTQFPGVRPGEEAEAIQAARKRRGGPSPGVTYGAHNPAAYPSYRVDAAALADAEAERDRAWVELMQRNASAWRNAR